MNPTQLIIVIGMLALGGTMLVLGGLAARRDFSLRTVGDPISGFSLGIALTGASIVLVAIEVANQLTHDWDAPTLMRWWFLAPAGDNGLAAALGNPVMNLFCVAVLVFFLGLPSWTQVRAFLWRLTSPKTRAETILFVLGALAWVVLSVGAAFAVYAATGSRFLGSVAYAIVAWGLLGLTTLILARLGERRRRRGDAG